MSNKLESRKIVKNFISGEETIEVLRDINLTIERGDYIIISGPSGAGKSTLIHILSGLLFPTGGEVVWEGKNIYTFSEEERCSWRRENVGLIFQFFYLLSDLTVLENIYVAGWKKWGREKSRMKSMEILKELHLEHLKNRYPQEISGGEQQRVAMGRAIINEPYFIFADEPTGNLDKKSGEEVIMTLEEIRERRNTALIIATHRIDLIERANKVIYLEDGRLKSGKGKMSE